MSTVAHVRIQNKSKRVILSILIPLREEGLARPTTMKASETALEEESDEEEEEEEEEPRTEAESEKDKKEEVRKRILAA